jgi:hypothetical protein
MRPIIAAAHLRAPVRRTAGASLRLILIGLMAGAGLTEAGLVTEAGAAHVHAQAASGQDGPGMSATTLTRADTVRLRFNWVAGTSARIETTRFSVRVAETSDTAAGGARYRMDAHGHAEGLLISYSDFVFPPPEDTTDSAGMNSLAEQASAIVPKFIVDTAGEFVRLEDVSAVRAQFDSLVTRVLPPDEAAATREALETMLSEEALTGLAVQEWNAIVGMWAGTDLVIGESYTFTEDAALPMISGATVPMVSEFSIERRTSCIEGGADDDCVEIHLVGRPDPVAMREILAQFTERLLSTPGLGGLGFESLEVENEMVLITEPSTLRPHRVVLSKSVKGVVAADGQRSEVSQTDVRTYRYSYSP